ncbi:hypothetical protein HW932_20125 [Allochromatium humboldtianum]|uniref:Uncharacterized protein n=1 Tax=Allochromatium humboldtianum TaxID=504901 RepID=A0A850R9Z3_9GAMM|nr:hypothetical protein [Allochromatium humboldtianum]NVZ11559.1 hypothetical protein [Allochromatium humboldtianum]
MIEYRLSLLEQPGNLLAIAFDCDADDLAHAIEQAQNAYPEGRILACTPLADIPERYWAITGSIPGDDASTTLTLTARTKLHAIRAFEDEMWADEPDADVQRESLKLEHGVCVFIESIVASASPIEIVS